MITSLLVAAALTPVQSIHPRQMAEIQASNKLTAFEQQQGFTLLFDGKTIEHWRGFRKTDVPKGWQAIDGELRFVPGVGGGDIVTKEQYENFDLRLEWKVAPGGNSGIFFRGTEDKGSIWETAPEMQVLDNKGHRDGQSPFTSAGSNYALYAPSEKVAKPAGQWNAVRIKVADNDVEYWLNGVRVVRYVLHSDEWKGLVAKSKFASMPDYGMRRVGHIALQDHGDPVSFRNLKIRRL